MATCAAAIKADRLEQERWDKEWEDKKRLMEAEKRRENLEKKRSAALENHRGRWQKAMARRVYADAIEKRMTSENLDWVKVKERLASARSQDEIDILSNGLPILQQEEDFRAWEL